MNTLAFWKDILSISKDIATLLGIIVGGAWTYLLVIKNRQLLPRAEITNYLHHRSFENNKLTITHLRIKAQIKNTGQVKISLQEGCIVIHQLYPITDTIITSKAVVDGQFDWKRIERRDWKPDKCEIYEIEPGESHDLYFDFFIPEDVDTILITSYMRNTAKKKWAWKWGLPPLFRKDTDLWWSSCDTYDVTTSAQTRDK